MNLCNEKDRKNIALKDEDPGMETISVSSSNYGKHGIWDGSKDPNDRRTSSSSNLNSEEEEHLQEATRHSDLDSLVDCSRSRVALGNSSSNNYSVRRRSSHRLSDKHSLAELDTSRQERRVNALRRSHTRDATAEEQEGEQSPPQVGSIDFYRLVIDMDCSSASAPASTESQARLRLALQKKVLNTTATKRRSSNVIIESKRRGTNRLPPKSHSLDSGRALAFQLGNKDQSPQMPLRCASRRELASLACQMVQAEQAAARYRAPEFSELARNKKKKKPVDSTPKKTASVPQQEADTKKVPQEEVVVVADPPCQAKAELKSAPKRTPMATVDKELESKPPVPALETPVGTAAKPQTRVFAAQLEVAAVAAVKAEEASAGSSSFRQQLSRSKSVKRIANGSFRLLKKSLSRAKLPVAAYAQIESDEEEEEEEELDLSGKLSRSLPWGLKCVEVPARNQSGCGDDVSVCSSVSMDSEGEDSDSGMTTDEEEEEQSITEEQAAADTKAALDASHRLRRRSSRSHGRRRRSRSRRRRRRRSGMHQSYSSSGSGKGSRRRRSSRRERGDSSGHVRSSSRKQLASPGVPAAATAAASLPAKIRRVANAQA